MNKMKLYLITALLALLGLYTYVWYLGANKLEMALVDQGKVLEKKGYRISYSAIRVKGFPLKINLEIDDVIIEAPSPVDASFAIKGTLHGYASLLDPTCVTFKSAEGIDIKTALLGAENNTVLKAKGLQAQMPLPLPLEDFKVTFNDLHIGAIDIKAKALTLGFQLHKNDRSRDIYSFSIENVDPGKQLVEGLPQIIDHIKGRLSLKGKIGTDLPLEKALSRWSESEGAADIALFSIGWGKLLLETNGTLALDEALQPVAAFSAEIYGLEEILDRLKSLGFIHENLLPILKMSLSFLKESKPAKEGQGKDIYHKLAITFQENDLLIGSIPVMKFPPLNWAKLGEQ